MGKFTHDPPLLISKRNIGIYQLEDAIRLFLDKRYLSAITLAGAADAIFCGLIEESGGKAPANIMWSEIEFHRSRGIPLGGKITKKEAFKQWNDTRNSLKHHDKGRDSEFLELFEIDEAYIGIERARHSAKILDIEPDNICDFDNLVIPWFFLSEES